MKGQPVADLLCRVSYIAVGWRLFGIVHVKQMRVKQMLHKPRFFSGGLGACPHRRFEVVYIYSCPEIDFGGFLAAS